MTHRNPDTREGHERRADPTTTLLQINDLVKTYPGVRAVDGVSLTITEGCCFGLLGPNGAGKTTILEMLEGISEPDSGVILYRGRPRTADYRAAIGIQFQNTALQDFQTVREAMQLFASFYPRSRSAQELIDLCNLEELLDRDTRQLSGGQRQRLLLAIALIHDPDIVFLDEPTTGLDPQSRRNFWRLVETIKAEGKTILLTTHYMEEASTLCDRIAIIDLGRIIEEGSPSQLLTKHFPKALVKVPLRAMTSSAQMPSGFEVQHGHAVAATNDIDATLSQLAARQIPLHELQISTPTLDDLFLKLTGHGLREP